MLKNAKDIIRFIEEFSHKTIVTEEDFLQFVEHVSLSYKLFILSSFIIPMDKKTKYDKQLVSHIYDYSRYHYSRLYTDKQGAELLKRFQDNIVFLCSKLDEAVKPYNLRFRALRYPKSVQSEVDMINLRDS